MRREAGSGKREAGRKKREAGSGKRADLSPFLLRAPCSLLLCLLLGLLPTLVLGAPSKQLVAPGTPVTFSDAGGAPALDFSAVAAGAGRYSDRYDKGTGSQPADLVWNCQFQLNGSSTAGQVIEVYVAWSDGTHADGELGTTKGTLASDKRRDLKLVGIVVVDQNASNPLLTASGRAYIPTRYYHAAYWNGTGLALATGTTLMRCTFTPHPVEMQ